MSGDDLPMAVDAMERVWAGGGRAASAAPPAWRDAVGNATGDEAELRLLALAAQAARLALRPVPEGDAPARAPLPRLALPTMPEGVRGRFRAATGSFATAPALAVELVAARGWSVHPLDWMPPLDGNAPALYRPWIEWRASEAPVPERLTEETWDELTPAPRRMMLHDLRGTDPAAARSVLEAKLASRPAEERAELVCVMRAGLSDEDAEFLRSLATDRSGRVKEEAARLLARLDAGEGDTNADAIRALIEPRTSGLLRRRRGFRLAKAMRSDARLARRTMAALHEGSLRGVAAALGATTGEFVAGWEWGEGDPQHDTDIASMIARTGSDGDVAATVDAVIASDAVPHRALLPMLSRLDAPSWVRLRERLLARSPDDAGGPVGDLMAVLTSLPDGVRALGTAPADAVTRSGLLAWLRTPDPKGAAYDRRPADALAFLGLVASREGAGAALAAMEAAGRPRADPELALLRLNASLPDHSPDHDGANP